MAPFLVLAKSPILTICKCGGSYQINLDENFPTASTGKGLVFTKLILILASVPI